MATAQGTTGGPASPLIRAAIVVAGCSFFGCGGRATNVLESNEGTPGAENGSGGSGNSSRGGSGNSSRGGSGGKTNEPEDPTWGCADNQTGESSLSEITNMTFRLTNDLGGRAVAGANATLCWRVDTACIEPVASATSNADGRVTLPIPDTFSGYVSFASAVATPTLFALTGREFEFAPSENVVPLLPPKVLALFTELVGNPQKNGNGFVLAYVIDCAGKPGENVTFDWNLAGENADASVFYAVDGTPAKEARSTDSSGYGALANVAPGMMSLRAIVGAKTVSTAFFLVKPNSSTIVRLRAGP